MVTQLAIHMEEYWASADFALSDNDIEQIYNHFLEVERPQTIEQITQQVIRQRLADEKNKLKPRLEGRIVYQPGRNYAVGDKLVFPLLQFMHGTVSSIRPAGNPQTGPFQAILVKLENGKEKEFAAEFEHDHPLNEGDGLQAVNLEAPNPDAIFAQHAPHLIERITAQLQKHGEFVRLGRQWFVKGLMLDINIGHLHLAEAVLEMNEGGPLPTPEIMEHLDLSKKIRPEVQEFSLNYNLLHDDRFDEVAPPGKVLWFLRRMEPANVREAPDRLVPDKRPYDPALLSKNLLQLERELDDEWSELEGLNTPRQVTVTLTYPHRWAGTLPLSSKMRPLFPLGITQRQIVTLADAETGDEMPVWVVSDGRYISGLNHWYRENKIPIGAYISLAPSDEPGVVLIDCQRRPKPRREWVWLATVEDGKLRFQLDKRAIGCEYDDLMIVGTDFVAAVDALFRSSAVQNRPLANLLAEIMPSLSESGPQNAVHAKTLYSAINMIRRVTPGAVFAELVRHPAFVAVGDYYWQFDQQRWQNR